MKLTIAIVLVTATYVSAYEPECLLCEPTGQPVCGQNVLTGETKTFDNECLLRRENCLGTIKYVEILEEKCPTEVPECASFCLDLNEPICAIWESGRWANFTNECQMKKANCYAHPGARKIADGLCPAECRPCEKINETFDKPVCGKSSDGELATFPNLCALQLEQCKTKNKYPELISEGECVIP